MFGEPRVFAERAFRSHSPLERSENIEGMIQIP
jgi:hypothetical protein